MILSVTVIPAIEPDIGKVPQFEILNSSLAVYVGMQILRGTNTVKEDLLDS
jgi:hypothetical protein